MRRSKGAVPTAFGLELSRYAQQALEAFDKVGDMFEARRTDAVKAGDTFRVLLNCAPKLGRAK